MATVTPNFNWPVPTSTDLVKDGATAIEALGDSIDASLVDLKGGTTGQVLSKTSNTDMDFTWVAADDTNAIQNTIVDAKGDLIAASAADTPARLAVGSNGETLVADSSTATGLRYQANFAAGKNKIINGDFGIWQRGTSVTVSASTTTYLADRFSTYMDTNAGTYTYSRQTFTPGTAPVAGYEGQYFARLTTGGNCNMSFSQAVEDVRTFAGQKVTISFWAKSSTAKTFNVVAGQNFGTGGSAYREDSFGSYTTSTSWQRFTFTGDIASITGKTIGANSHLLVRPITYGSQTGNFDYDIWGVQIEASYTATAFQTATGTIQGELAACQRYYYRLGAGGGGNTAGVQFGYYLDATASSSTNLYGILPLPVTMRKVPTSVDYGSVGWIVAWGAGVNTISVITIYDGSGVVGTTPQAVVFQMTTTGATTNSRYPVLSNNQTAGYLGVSAEL